MSYAHTRPITIDHTKVEAALPRLSRAAWSATASSYLDSGGNYTPTQAITDGTKFWASNGEKPAHLIVNFGSAITFDHVEVDSLSDHPRTITSWEIYVSDDGSTWGSAIKTGSFPNTLPQIVALDSPVTKQYLKFRVVTMDYDNYVCVRDIWISNTVTSHTDFVFRLFGTFDFLADEAHGGGVKNASGYDIVFSSDEAGSNLLKFNRRRWSGTDGASYFCIKLPSISSSVDTLVYVHYGDAGVSTDQQDIANTFSNNFVEIYPLDDATSSGTMAGLLGNNGTYQAGAASVAGVVGPAMNVHTGGVGYGPTLGTFGKTSQLTIEAVFVRKATGQGRICNLGGDTNYFIFGIMVFSSPTNDMYAQVGVAGVGGDNAAAGSLPSLHTWAFMAGTADGSYVQALVNGGAPIPGAYGYAASASDSSHTWQIGCYQENGTYYYAFPGYLQEIVISSVVRDTGWLHTEYENMINSGTFYEIGDEIGAAGSLLLNPDLRGGFRQLVGGL
jgi:F5/8 type C domain